MDLQITKFGHKMALIFQDVSNAEQAASGEESISISQAKLYYIKVGELPVGFSE